MRELTQVGDKVDHDLVRPLALANHQKSHVPGMPDDIVHGYLVLGYEITNPMDDLVRGLR